MRTEKRENYARASQYKHKLLVSRSMPPYPSSPSKTIANFFIHFREPSTLRKS